jgi:hypothetical protein
VALITGPDTSQDTGFLLTLLILGAFFVLGSICVGYCWYGLKRKRMWRGTSRRTYQDLFRWGVLTAQPSVEAEAADSEISPEDHSDRPEAAPDLDDPALRELMLEWSRLSARLGLGSGLGVLVACAVCAISLLLFPFHLPPATPLRLAGAALETFSFRFAAFVEFFTFAMCGGMALAMSRITSDLAQSRQSEEAFGLGDVRLMKDYRSPLVAWLPLVLGLIEVAFIIFPVPSAASTASRVLALGAEPLAALLGLAGVEWLLWGVAIAPLGTPRNIPTELSEATYPEAARKLLISALVSVSISIATLLPVVQFVTLLPYANAFTGVQQFALIVFVFLGSIICSFVGRSGGRLGGRLAGWPWSGWGETVAAYRRRMP